MGHNKSALLYYTVKIFLGNKIQFKSYDVVKLRDHPRVVCCVPELLIDFGTTRPIIFGCEQSYGFPIVWTWGIFVKLFACLT